ncbi:MAG: hypothetical protein JWO46_1587 [Nocardioidaceae bacterium]|nr:hypothetical protein [Nocardioidaceae bacterium]
MAQVSSEIKLSRRDAPSGRRHRPLPLVGLGTALVLVTYVTPVANTPATVADLGAGAGATAWMLSSMSLGLAAALLPSGAVGDALGRRRAYVVGLALMGLGALVCAVSQETVLFVAGRIVEGVGGAAILACGLAVLAHAFADPAARAHATGIWGASVGVGIAAGGILAAALGSVGTGWRESYVVVGVLCLALVPASARALPESSAAHPRRLDLPGLVVLVAAMTVLLSGITRARGGISGSVVVLLLVAVVLLAGFVLIEARVREPMVEPRLAAAPGFVAANVGALVVGLGIIGMVSTTPTYVQTALGGSLWVATAQVLFWAVSSVATSLVVRRLRIPISGPHLIAVSLVVVAVGELLALGVHPGSSPWRLAPAFVVAGLATGILNAVMGREAVANVPPDRAAMGSGSNNTARYLGAACGITVFSLVTSHVGWDQAVWFAAGISLVGAVGCLLDGFRNKQA